MVHCLYLRHALATSGQTLLVAIVITMVTMATVVAIMMIVLMAIVTRMRM